MADLVEVGRRVGRDVLLGQPRPRRRAPRGIAHLRREPPDDQHRGVPMRWKSASLRRITVCPMWMSGVDQVHPQLRAQRRALAARGPGDLLLELRGGQHLLDTVEQDAQLGFRRLHRWRRRRNGVPDRLDDRPVTMGQHAPQQQQGRAAVGVSRRSTTGCSGFVDVHGTRDVRAGAAAGARARAGRDGSVLAELSVQDREVVPLARVPQVVPRRRRRDRGRPLLRAHRRRPARDRPRDPGGPA